VTINHLNLVVENVPETVHLFEAYFGFRCDVVKGGSAIAVLRNEAGFVLVLMSDRNGEISYPKNFHLGIILDDRAAVDKLHEMLVDGGIDAGPAPRKIRDSHAFYVHYDKLFIEVAHYF
jgi:lactoylglutathione lyase